MLSFNIPLHRLVIGEHFLESLQSDFYFVVTRGQVYYTLPIWINEVYHQTGLEPAENLHVISRLRIGRSQDI